MHVDLEIKTAIWGEVRADMRREGNMRSREEEREGERETER